MSSFYSEQLQTSGLANWDLVAVMSVLETYLQEQADLQDVFGTTLKTAPRIAVGSFSVKGPARRLAFTVLGCVETMDHKARVFCSKIVGEACCVSGLVIRGLWMTLRRLDSLC